ncbi:CD63 antigen isoform X2 [Cephus cinctus]|uniref:CD63 antigen isoform X2 n=1 Tax=Cephus cinctus TaxID=211228 RepID=A0AAJ7RIR3_CEPCN|nr:CD63 antigen isoform X2 [Cephus cinctus]
MSLRKFFLHNIMRRAESTNEDDTETESVDEDVTDSEESAHEKRVHFLGLPLAGITATITSVWMLSDSKLMSRLFSQRLFVTILLLVGLFACSVSFIGIMAFVKKRRKFITVYILCHVLSLTFIFICAILSFSFFDKITQKIHNDMTSTIVNYHSLDWVTEAWDNTQKYLRCCGIWSFRDWDKYRMQIPHSCCSSTIEKCLNMSQEVSYQSGCLKDSIILLKSHIHSVSVSALLISIGLVVGLFLAFGIRRRFKTYQRD